MSMKTNMSLQLIEAFVTLARTRNFTRAATELNLSQSALSRAIQRLEEQLGQPVVERRPREVQLTQLGELLLERSTHLLKMVEDTFAELAEAGKKSRVRLGAIPTIAPYFLPSVLSGFAQRFPEVAVIVQEDTTDHLIKRCTQGEIDLCILALPIAAKQLQTEALVDEELLLVLPIGHPLAKTQQVAVGAMDGYPFVMLNEAHCLTQSIASFCRQQSVQPVTVERTSQLTMVQELVTLNHGVSLVPEMARKLDISDRRVYRSFTGPKPDRTVAMMWNPDRFQSPATATLMEFLRQHAQEMSKPQRKGKASPR
jgi:LysR family transcriptional regulator, hydrogen peroxide-inducible genes activator